MFRNVESTGRTRRVFPVLGATETVNIGGADLVQVVEGAQPGTVLSFRNPIERGYDLEHSVRAERDGELYPLARASEYLWVTWPNKPNIDTARALVLRTWSPDRPDFNPSVPREHAPLTRRKLVAHGFEVEVGTSANLTLIDWGEAESLPDFGLDQVGDERFVEYSQLHLLLNIQPIAGTGGPPQNVPPVGRLNLSERDTSGQSRVVLTENVNRFTRSSAVTLTASYPRGLMQVEKPSLDWRWVLKNEHTGGVNFWSVSWSIFMHT